MDNPYESRDWRIRVRVDWTLKKGVVEYIPCASCGGDGETSGWGNLDEYPDNRCGTCWGSGKVKNPDIEPMPRMPEVFRNYMRGYFHKFFDMMDKKREENEKKVDS